jgi:lincosamide nucleotidyltransferase A/C/D/E
MLPDGSLHYGPVVGGDTFPGQALGGEGTIAGVTVRCEAPDWAVRWHTGYPPRPTDHHDIARLCGRFGVPVPDAFNRR